MPVICARRYRCLLSAGAAVSWAAVLAIAVCRAFDLLPEEVMLLGNCCIGLATCLTLGAILDGSPVHAYLDGKLHQVVQGMTEHNEWSGVLAADLDSRLKQVSGKLGAVDQGIRCMFEVVGEETPEGIGDDRPTLHVVKEPEAG